jgi:hypothetical protein
VLALADEEIRCTACGLPIVGEYMVVRGEEGAWCASCAEESRPCSLCGAPARNPEVVDGRILCDECARHIVDEEAAFHRLYSDVRRRLGDLLDRPLGRDPELVIVPIEHVDRRGLAGAVPIEKLGGVFTREADGRTRIQLISPLTEPRARAVLAHELAHAWQSEHCPENQGIRLREGFAEWVAWASLDGIDSCTRERTKIAGRTDEYGQGFQLFRGLEERGGREAAIRYARSARKSVPAD